MTTDIGVTFDCANPILLGSFWARALGYTEEGSDDGYAAIVDPQGLQPRILFMKVPEPKVVKNRVHLDLHVADMAAEVKRLLGLGATRIGMAFRHHSFPVRRVIRSSRPAPARHGNGGGRVGCVLPLGSPAVWSRSCRESMSRVNRDCPEHTAYPHRSYSDIITASPTREVGPRSVVGLPDTQYARRGLSRPRLAVRTNRSPTALLTDPPASCTIPLRLATQVEIPVG